MDNWHTKVERYDQNSFYVLGYYLEELRLYWQRRTEWEQRMALGKSKTSKKWLMEFSCGATYKDVFDYDVTNALWYLNTNGDWTKKFLSFGTHINMHTTTETTCGWLSANKLMNKFRDKAPPQYNIVEYDKHLLSRSEPIYCDYRYWKPINCIDSEWVI
jgi:hypothetical protein